VTNRIGAAHEGDETMKAIIGLLLLAWAAPAQDHSIGVCATPHLVDGAVFLTASLVGDVKSLPVGTIVRLMRGQTVVSTTIIADNVRLPIIVTPIGPPIAPSMASSAITSLPLRGIAQVGDTVSITPPTGSAYSITISPIIIGTVDVENMLSVFLMNAAPSASVFIEGQSLSVSNLSLGVRGLISVNSITYHGWHTVTACQPGVCDTVIVRLP
jgi:hypothetical protein